MLRERLCNSEFYSPNTFQTSSLNALYKSLGSAAAMRFLTLLHKTLIDYVQISRTIYQDQTINEIVY